MKALRTLSWALCATALVLFLMVAFPAQKAEAWLTSKTFTWISGDSSYFRRINLDTVSAWHNYDIKFNATPAASNGDGSRMFNFTTTMATDPASSGAEWSNIYGSATYTAGTNGVFTFNGVEGVARPNASALGGTFRGGYFRTYASGVNYKVTSMIGSDFSVRSIDNWNPKLGTAAVGARIWMAIHPATAAMGQDSINNYHGLWIYDENTSGLATTNAIKIGTGGARFKYDFALQDGQTITDTTGGTRFNKPIIVDTAKAKIVQGFNGGAVRLVKQGSTADADTALTVRDNGGTLLMWGDTTGAFYATGTFYATGGGMKVDRNYLYSDGGVLYCGTSNADGETHILASNYGMARALQDKAGFAFGYATNANGDTTKGWVGDSLELRGKMSGSRVKADTVKAKVVAMAKDTSVEIASFGRTAIADTAAVITGVDSLTCAYLITPFATRNVITAVPTVSGIAATSNLLIIRRPAADTAAYDRYSIVRLPQR